MAKISDKLNYLLAMILGSAIPSGLMAQENEVTPEAENGDTSAEQSGEVGGANASEAATGTLSAGAIAAAVAAAAVLAAYRWWKVLM
ncbi:MAG: hypothetical protein ABR63_04170 [SAR86 cluster bacterium BACL1 MAG-120920-bin57]|uniref:Uncharacterized protein n=1 Tax=SAR86 cluster bacterium BACL1 MAG-120920-bin57 TaxID=1655571 RepID=A0A0R2PN10_9GAMM|nr:MAG: hypothetical protein ABR63_04170 [SAR86 cluster bacterium BACL1 MAG-120920-bin57]